MKYTSSTIQKERAGVSQVKLLAGIGIFVVINAHTQFGCSRNTCEGFEVGSLLPKRDKFGSREKKEREKKAREALARVGLEDHRNHRPSELSGGQQQRVAIARAIVTEPYILLADEPTGALDSVSSKNILDIFDELHQEGRTIVMITHDPEVAERAERQIFLYDGEIVEDEFSSWKRGGQ